MNLSRTGIEHIKKSEALRLVAYRDTKGVWTIGWGETHGVKAGDTCTKEQADEWLSARVSECEQAVTKFLAGANIGQHQFDVICSLYYNLGPKIIDTAQSTFARKVLAGKMMAATAQIARWNKITINGKAEIDDGLVNRRTEEAILFAGDN